MKGTKSKNVNGWTIDVSRGSFTNNTGCPKAEDNDSWYGFDVYNKGSIETTLHGLFTVFVYFFTEFVNIFCLLFYWVCLQVVEELDLILDPVVMDILLVKPISTSMKK